MLFRARQSSELGIRVKRLIPHAIVAQLVEQPPCKRWVGGSSPFFGSKVFGFVFEVCNRHVSGTEPLGNVSVAKEHGTGSSSVGRAMRRGFESHLLDNIFFALLINGFFS